MTLKTPIKHSCDIKCPVCNHKFIYDFKIDNLSKVKPNEENDEAEIKYNFDIYLICKNPLCNYDIEVKGNVFEHPEDILKNVEIKSVK